MKHMKKTISLLLMTALMLTMLSVGVISSSAAERLLGDADNNGIVNVGDATHIQMAIAKMDIEGRKVDYDTMDKSSLNFKAADVDKNGTVNVGDATLIQMFAAHMTQAQGYGIEQPITAGSGSATIKIYDLEGKLAQTVLAEVGSRVTVVATLDMSGQNDGLIQAVDGRVAYTSSVVKPVMTNDDDYEQDMFPVITAKTSIISNIGEKIDDDISQILYNATGTDRKNAYQFDSADAILTKVEFEVIAQGEAEVRNTLVMLAFADDATTRIVDNGTLVPGKSFTGQTAKAEGVTPVDPPEPGDDTATIMVYDLNGKLSLAFEAKVGDTFIVTTALDMSGQNDGLIQAVDGRVTYTSSVVKPVMTNDDDYEQDMFPVITAKTSVISNIGVASDTPGMSEIQFNATGTNMKNAYHFDSSDAVLVRAAFTVIGRGTAEIRNNLITLAFADDYTTRIIDMGEKVSGRDFTGQGVSVER